MSCRSKKGTSAGIGYADSCGDYKSCTCKDWRWCFVDDPTQGNVLENMYPLVARNQWGELMPQGYDVAGMFTTLCNAKMKVEPF